MSVFTDASLSVLMAGSRKLDGSKNSSYEAVAAQLKEGEKLLFMVEYNGKKSTQVIDTKSQFYATLEMGERIFTAEVYYTVSFYAIKNPTV